MGVPAGLYRLDRELTREQLIDELAALPQRVRDAVVTTSEEALTHRATPDAWSAFDVCKHLRDATQVYGMRFKWMVLQDDPLLANYDEDGWVAKHSDSVSAVAELLSELAAYRSETIRLLRSLSDDGWKRTGQHQALGTIALEPYVRHQVEHESQHLAQLHAALKQT